MTAGYLYTAQATRENFRTVQVINSINEEPKGLRMQPLRFGDQLFLNEMELELLSDCFGTQADIGE
jgi:hypothetical protein